MSEEKNIKLPTDEQVIELLRKIKEYCTFRQCKECVFYHENSDCEDIYICTIRALFSRLEEEEPCNWYMEEIERIIKL